MKSGNKTGSERSGVTDSRYQRNTDNYKGMTISASKKKEEEKDTGAPQKMMVRVSVKNVRKHTSTLCKTAFVDERAK